MDLTRRTLGAAAISSALVSPAIAASPARWPLVIAHRGASGERPEHTLAAYGLAIAQGADFIEPDLVVTRDGVLVCRHEPEIGGTTDVADRREFAARRKTRRVDGGEVTGWFVHDFTLAELKTLRCRERIPQVRPGNAAYDGQEAVPTFAEVVELARDAGRRVGIYPELKHPTSLATDGHDVVALLAAQLKTAGLDAADAPVFVQCFEVAPLQRLRTLIRAPLIQLVSAADGPYDRAAAGAPVTYSGMLTPPGLAAVAAYADGIGAEKTLIVPRDEAGRSQRPTTLIADAHAAGLKVHAWTFRSENAFLPRELRRGDAPGAKGDAAAEYAAFAALGIDGVFSDFPGEAVRALGVRP